MPIDGAYVVFEGRKPGVYRTWDECEAQLNGAESRYQMFETIGKAKSVWLSWQQKIYRMPPPHLHQNVQQPQVQEDFRDSPGCPNAQTPTYIPPAPTPAQRNTPLQTSSATSRYASSADQHLVLITPPCSSPSSSLKRTSSQMDIFDDGFGTKRQRIDTLGDESIELARLQRQTEQVTEEESTVKLTLEQEKAVNLALRKNNIFLTGAAGSGKTTVLKEILRKFGKRKNYNVQVIAPTGIAALPLGGKTTYSFAGVSVQTLVLGRKLY
jgi:flagellar biosynthesis GTPase FlhF